MSLGRVLCPVDWDAATILKQGKESSIGRVLCLTWT
jgi:hypothetical protein